MRILVVEDEPNVLSFIEQGLKEESYAVDVATDDELALDFAQTYPYNVVVLDVLLPKVNGWQVAQTLPARGLSTPMIMLTVLDDVDDKISGLAACRKERTHQNIFRFLRLFRGQDQQFRHKKSK